MLQLRPNCECCNIDLPPDSRDARICTFECTFCAECSTSRLKGVCPNCGGELLTRPRRPASKLAKYPATTERVYKPEGCATNVATAPSTLVQVGESFETNIMLSAEDIKAFATLCGDTNPLHHDRAFAEQSRFGRVIAAGPHFTALFMAMTADYFSKRAGLLGLEFSFSFRIAVAENDPLRMRWEVIDVTPKTSLGGEIVTLRGTITNGEGKVAVTGLGKCLVTTEL